MDTTLNYYSDFTLDYIEQILKGLCSKKSKNTFTIFCNKTTYQLYDITSQEHMGLISAEEANLKRYASCTNSYISSKWNYLKYPQIYFRNEYSNSFTNEKFEEGEEDIYGDCEMIYIGRTND